MDNQPIVLEGEEADWYMRMCDQQPKGAQHTKFELNGYIDAHCKFNYLPNGSIEMECDFIAEGRN